MIVVSNTSPIYYLWGIGEIRLLSHLFTNIFIPEAVCAELCHKNCPPALQTFIKKSGDWMQIRKVHKSNIEELSRLHAGKREAILLALELKADLIILDEKKARTIAKNLGFGVTGLLGIVDEAAKRNLIDITKTIEKLNKTNFRIAPSILKSLLNKYLL